MQGSRIEHQQLYVHLTQDEFNVRSDELAKITQDINLLDEERKVAVKRYRERISEMTVERDLLANVVSEHREKRSVECHWEENWGRKTMELYRQDTGEMVNSRDMTAEERQGVLKLVDYPAREQGE